MTPCRDIEPQLSLYLDHELPEADAAVVRAHLEACAACAGLVADLERLTGVARALGPVPPPPFLSRRIAAALSAPGSAGATDAPRGRPRWHWAAVAAALVALVGLATSTRWLPAPITGTNDRASSSAGLAAVASELELAVHHYERAIAELEVVAAGGSGLSPDVARSIRTSLITLDRAIAESRQVLVADPSDELARISLFEALRRKVDLLQATVLMMGDGNQNPEGTMVPVRGTGSDS